VAINYSRDAALASLAVADPLVPPSKVARILADPINDELLGYVFADAFTHVFPGDLTEHPPPAFLADLDAELADAPLFHLWAEIPLCRYRCHFCQFPILVTSRDNDTSIETARRWVDANITEAKLWLDAVPALRHTPVGEFCLFGGTPTAIPTTELTRLTDFYLSNFTFTADSSLRAEGSPDSLDRATLAALHDMGYLTLTYGIQSFDDELLAIANRRHTGDQAGQALVNARELGFERVDGDLVWGLPGQTVPAFAVDVERMIKLDFSTIVIIKLHLRSFLEVDSAVGHVSRAAWEDKAVRARLAERGYRWPSLGEQFQMRETGVAMLTDAGYVEHPTTYFAKRDVGPERWRALNLDQDKQVPQVGIGLGGYAWSSRSEAHSLRDPQSYLATVRSGEIPFESITAISDRSREVRAVRMAMSTCQPLRDDVHQARFTGSSLFTGRWAHIFGDLADRGLVRVDHGDRRIRLTPEGSTLVEAIINTQIR
jgi:oxygen-independent coproporphyrinogen-3 oxidase